MKDIIEIVIKLSEEDYSEICKCSYPNDQLVGELIYQVRNNNYIKKKGDSNEQKQNN